MKISVIIPTYNRKEILKNVLLGYNNQSFSNFEIIVIDDGSTDNTKEMISNLNINYKIIYLRQENKSPASARNMGIKQAEGKIVFITGDDIIPHNELLLEHIKSYKKNTAILGKNEWYPKMNITPFMKKIEKIQFDYDLIKNKEDDEEKNYDDCGYRVFFTSNISLEKKWFDEDLFDEDFPYPAYEDTEIGYRLEQKGLKIRYNKNAVGYHYHNIDIDSFCKRQELCGKSMGILLKKHPNINDFKKQKIFLNHKFLISFSLFALHLISKYSWKSKIFYHYLKGLSEFKPKII